MLNIMQSESTNVCNISGILSQLDVEEKSTADGRDYVQAKAVIKVDQEVGGKMIENEIPVKFFSMKMKSDGSAVSKIYTAIANFPQTFTSLAALPDEDKSLASKVVINAAHIEENIWVDPNSGEARTTWQIGSNFMNPAKGDFEEGARFELSGVILGRTREVDQNGEETGRLKVKFGVIRYKGRLDVVELIADSENAVNFIESNWEDGDTVNVNGAISFNQTQKVWYEEQGFGESIKRTKTISRKELIILGGSQSGLEEEFSYDSNAIKAALDERQGRVQEQKTKSNVKGKSQNKSFNDNLGF